MRPDPSPEGRSAFCVRDSCKTQVQTCASAPIEAWDEGGMMEHSAPGATHRKREVSHCIRFINRMSWALLWSMLVIVVSFNHSENIYMKILGGYRESQSLRLKAHGE